MNIFLYAIIFVMGTVFGSFYTLAIYRIPKKIDITHTHSFCPNCEHKLGFFELIPIWSYIFQRGKCTKCKQKIRPRYLIIELVTGIAFVLISIGAKVDFYNLDINILIWLAFMVLYLSAIVIIAGIDKELRQIERSVIYYALGIMVLYIIYLCMVDRTNIYRYVMYLSITVVLLIIDTIKLRKNANISYILSILMLITIMTVFTGEGITVLSITMTLLIIGFENILNKIKNIKSRVIKDKKVISKNLRIGFFMCTSNIIMLISMIFMINW